MKCYYHVSSSALEKNDIFQNREDFVTGMNDVALCSLKFSVRIICFCLMSNHFHFVLCGSYQECYAFMQEFKRMCAMRMRNARGEVNALHSVEMQFDLIDSKEYLENAIAYVLRNPLAARMLYMPYYYEWSSISAYFRGGREIAGVCANMLSIRKRRELLKTRYITVPDEFVLSEQGFVHPACYVDYEDVERIFGHPSRFMMSLAKRVENEFEIRIGASDRISMSDAELKSEIAELIRHEFRVSSMSQLSSDDRLRLCLLVRRNFNASIKQISRVLRISQDVVASVL